MNEVVWMDKYWLELERTGFIRVLPVDPNPFVWFLEQRQRRGREWIFVRFINFFLCWDFVHSSLSVIFGDGQ